MRSMSSLRSASRAPARNPRSVLAGLAAFAAVSAGALPAAPCEPPLPGVYGSIPAEGATYPANATVFFMGYDVTLDGVTATIDGAPATLVPVTPPPGFAELAVRLDPEPAPGATVLIEGAFCPAALSCQPASLSFTAGAPDLTAPAALGAVRLDVYDYVDFVSSGGDCQSSSDVGYFLDIPGTPAAAGEAPVFYTVDAMSSVPEVVTFFSRAVLATDAVQEVTFRVGEELLAGEPAPTGICFRVTASDASGNVAPEPVTVCKPCSYRKDPAGAAPISPPPEPAWTAADVFPGGTCDDGQGTGGSGTGGAGGGAGAGGDAAGSAEAIEIGGCGCVVAGSPASAAGACGLIALALATALRRGRRA